VIRRALLGIALWLGALVVDCAILEARGWPALTTLASPVHRALALRWPADGREQAWCLTYTTDTLRGVVQYRVTGLADAHATHRAPRSIAFDCPRGLAEYHTHHLIRGETCEPSPLDQEKLLARGDSFALIGCGPQWNVPYYPPMRGHTP
jgi:hypothetical protein